MCKNLPRGLPEVLEYYRSEGRWWRAFETSLVVVFLLTLGMIGLVILRHQVDLRSVFPFHALPIAAAYRGLKLTHCNYVMICQILCELSVQGIEGAKQKADAEL